MYQKGIFIEQWTIKFENTQNDERGFIKVRFSPEHFSEIIEFDVELNPIPVDDGKGKDIIINWQLFNGFNPKSTFWTDSNGLGMIKRELVQVNTGMRSLDNTEKANYKTISDNYFPVDTAIVMRDLSKKSDLQVTILNDRPQGGSADLTGKATIELMQNRRTLLDDDLGVDESLNETEADGMGIRSNANYYM